MNDIKLDVTNFSKIQLSLASPEEIERWATRNGVVYEVTKGETINYRTQKPEKDGLFCERIFGPTKDWCCSCGAIKKRCYAGLICKKCGTEVTTKSVRRERMSFIRLAVPVTHIWYLKGTPSRIGEVLDIPVKQLEDVAYFISHVIINDGGCEQLKCHRGADRVLTDVTYRVKFTEIIMDLISKGVIEEGTEDIEDARDILDAIDPKNSSSLVNFEVAARFIKRFYPDAEFGKGAEALLRLLSDIDLDAEIADIKSRIASEQSKKKDKEEKEKAKLESAKDAKKTKSAKTTLEISQNIQKLEKRLEILRAFKESGNKPEWMIIQNLPVIPPDLRPMLPLDGSRFAAADLNELYRRVVQRNNSLKDLISKKAPDTMLTNAKRVLQEAVDALFDNDKKSKPVTAQNGRSFKSLSAALAGKQGRFRQNLLGKRVDYSGRSVIAVGPNLRMDECGLPREMALQLFKPFIGRKLVEKGKATSPKAAELMIERLDNSVWECLDEVIKTHPVLLNRAPTLHRLGIQAYHPRLVEGRAIRLFPLACTAFNADFDGDQMAVHVPLSNEAIWEAENLMLGSKNILGPKDGLSIVTPTKDMVLGNYYLTLEENKEDFLKIAEEARNWNDLKKAERYTDYANAEGKVFTNKEEAIVAYQTGQIHIHNRIAIRGSGMGNLTFTEEQNKSYIVTTPGKIIFNQIFDDDFPYLNNPKDGFKETPFENNFIKRGENIKEVIANMPLKSPFKKKQLSAIIEQFLKRFGVDKTSEMLNKLKDQGFQYATKSAVTVSLFDIVKLDEKQNLLDQAQNRVNQYEEFYEEGILTEQEKHKQVVKVWGEEKKEIGEKVYALFESNKHNPFYMMSDSGAGGSKDNFNQLAGMRGNMQNPNGDVIELPIKSNLRDGVTVSEFFNSTHGTRKGGADTALKTSKSGHLTRRLVDVAHSFTVSEEDCGCQLGMKVSAIVSTTDGQVIEPLKARLVGRYTVHDVKDAKGNVICPADTLITEKIADAIDAANIREVEIRNIFTCQSKHGVCRKCYGLNLATSRECELYDPVGVMAAQSIGEPGTQLTMRNFNTGGVAGGTDITRGLPRVEELLEARPPKGAAIISEIDGVLEEITEDNGRYTITVYNENTGERKTYQTAFGATLANQVNADLKLPAEFDLSKDILHGEDGHAPSVEKQQIVEGCTIYAGQKLTEGAIHIKQLLEITKQSEAVENYILKEIQKTYRLQGIEISDKHVEIIIKQMFRKVKVYDSGDTDLIVGSKITPAELTAANRKLMFDENGNFNPSKKIIPATAYSFVQGITRASIDVESFLSAASFQETTRVLTDAAISGMTDNLQGLKENVIIGKLIPCGTGMNPDHRFATPKKDTQE